MSKKKEKIRDAKKYDKFDYKVGSKSELLSFAVAFIVFLVSFIPALADFPRDILRLVCAVLSSYPFIIDAFYGIKETVHPDKAMNEFYEKKYAGYLKMYPLAKELK